MNKRSPAMGGSSKR